MSRPLRGLGWLLLPLLLLAGCATAPLTPEGADAWLRRQAQVAALDTWTLQGRFSLTLENEAWHANLHWQEQSGRYTLRVSTPLGQGAALIEGGPGAVTIQLPDGTRDEAPDAETLLTRHLGWQLPVDGLQWWIRGLPAPATSYRPGFDAEGRLERLEQDGWRIDYREYTTVDGLLLPRKVFLTRDRLDLRLVVSEWQLPAGG